MLRQVWLMVCGMALACPVFAQQGAGSAAPAIRDEAPVVVTGRLRGPGLWKVSRNGHVMHVLGTVMPLPERMEWVPDEVSAVLAQSSEVVLSPRFVVDTDLGFFGKLSMVPSLLRARRNPGDATLREVVPADAYARWLPLKQRYLGRDRGVEKMRPVFAAWTLYESAIERSGLSMKNVVRPVLEKGIERHGIRRTEPEVNAVLDDPRGALREFRASALDDLACFDRMLANLESDVPRMVERANAWAIGDIDALRTLPLGDQYQACRDAVLQADVARRHGMGNATSAVRDAWFDAVETAIGRNERSFAVVPMSEWLAPDGHLARLVAAGYEVESP